MRGETVYWGRFLQNQKGNALVLVAISMSLFLAVSAIVVDIGLALLEQKMLQTGTDAAALAGTRELVQHPESAVAVAEDYLLRNVNPVSSYQILKDVDNRGLDVRGEQHVKYFFAPLLGYAQGKVTAASAARLVGIASIQGAAPLAVEEHDFQFGEPYVLKQSPNGFSFENYLGPGNFGALSLGGQGATRYEENLKHGYPGWLSIGDIVQTETGNMAGPTKKAVDYLLSQCTHVPRCTPESFTPDCPKILLVPVYEDLGYVSEQVKQVKIKGFAAFMVTETSGGGVNSEITGYFVKTVAVGVPSTAAPDYGLSTVRLVKGDG